MKKRIATLAVGAIFPLLFGCSGQVAQAEGDKMEPGVIFTVSPSEVRDCDPPIVAKLTWDVTAAGLAGVKIYVLGRDGKETIFTEKGAVDSINTGPWVSGGMHFLLRDQSAPKQYADISVKSKSC